MIEEIARYGKFRNRDAPKDDKPVNTVNKSVDKSVEKASHTYNPDKWGTDIFNPFARYGI